MSTPLNRRTFFSTVARSLGGLTLAGLTPGWTLAAARPVAPTISRSTWAMGTMVNLSLLEKDHDPVLVDQAFAAVHRVDHTLSVHQSASALSQVNARPGQWHTAGPDLLAVSRAAYRFGDLTAGALDVTVLPVMRAYGFLPGGPPSIPLPALLERVDYTRLRLRDGRILLDDVGVDFGGLAKGYGVDEGVRVLRRAGAQAALLEAGGDIYALGRPRADRRWRIGLRDPKRPEALFATLDLEDQAIATSGQYIQSRSYKKATVGHILNPSTGQSVHHVLSATVVAPTAMEADALSTATSVLPPAQAQALIASLPGIEGIWLYADQSIYMTRGLTERLHLL